MSRLAVLTVVAAAVVAFAAFFGGRALHDEPAGATHAFDLSGPSYTPNRIELVESAGGFTGVGEAGVLTGDPLYSGRVSAVSDEAITIDAAAGKATLEVTGTDKLFRLDAFTGSPAVGDQVIVRTDPASGAIVAVLLVRE